MYYGSIYCIIKHYNIEKHGGQHGWTEIAITVPAEDVDRAGDIAQMVVPYGIYIEDYSNLEQEAWEIAHIDLIDEELLNKDRTKVLYMYISVLKKILRKPFHFCRSVTLQKEFLLPLIQQTALWRIG